MDCVQALNVNVLFIPVHNRYIGRKTVDVDKRLLQIKLPDIFNRSARSLTQRRFWKGNICMNACIGLSFIAIQDSLHKWYSMEWLYIELAFYYYYIIFI